jgi:hypothetical protein
VSGENIRTWLLDSGLASVDQGGRLVLTEAGAEAAAGLALTLR